MKNKYYTRILILTFSVAVNFYSIGQVRNNTSDSSKVAHAQPKAVPVDLSVMTPPDGFEVSDKFHGYISPKMGSAIIMNQIDNVSYVILKQAMTDAYFQKNKLTKLSETKLITNSGLKGVIYKCSFHTQKTDFVRYMIYAGNLTKTIWVNATYPKMVGEIMEPALLKSFKTLHFIKKPKK